MPLALSPEACWQGGRREVAFQMALCQGLWVSGSHYVRDWAPQAS